MNKLFTLRSLTIFSFVIFLLPFMRTCSDESIRFSVKEQVEINESTPYENNDFIKNENAQKLISDKKEIYTFNFYTLAVVVFDGFSWNDASSVNDFYAFLGFTIILFLSIFILFFAFKNNFKIISLISSANLLILFISTLILWLNKTIESFSQFKIGYFLFVLNTFLIVYLSPKLQNEKDDLKI